MYKTDKHGDFYDFDFKIEIEVFEWSKRASMKENIKTKLNAENFQN